MFDLFDSDRYRQHLLGFLARAQRKRADEYGKLGFRFVDLNTRDAATTLTDFGIMVESRYCLTCGEIVTYPRGACHIPSRHITIPLSWVRLWCRAWDHDWWTQRVLSHDRKGDIVTCARCGARMDECEKERGLFLKIWLANRGVVFTARGRGDIPAPEIVFVYPLDLPPSLREPQPAQPSIETKTEIKPITRKELETLIRRVEQDRGKGNA